MSSVGYLSRYMENHTIEHQSCQKFSKIHKRNIEFQIKELVAFYDTREAKVTMSVIEKM